jgi:hypothetical protein
MHASLARSSLGRCDEHQIIAVALHRVLARGVVTRRAETQFIFSTKVARLRPVTPLPVAADVKPGPLAGAPGSHSPKLSRAGT